MFRAGNVHEGGTLRGKLDLVGRCFAGSKMQ